MAWQYKSSMCTDWAPSVFVTYDLRVEEEWNVNAPVEQLDLSGNCMQ